MGKKHSPVVDEIVQVQEELTDLAKDTARQAKGSLESRPAVPMVAIVTLVLLGVGLGFLLLRRRS